MEYNSTLGDGKTKTFSDKHCESIANRSTKQEMFKEVHQNKRNKEIKVIRNSEAFN